MIKAAVTRSSPLLLLAVLSCGTRQTDAGNAAAAPARKEQSAPPRTPSSGLKVSAEADQTPVRPGTGRVTRIMLGDLFQLQQEDRVLIFDVRPAFVYQLGHIPGAVNWPKSSFNSQLSRHEAQIAAARAARKPVALYCVDLACPDARTVATWLAGRGHNVTVLEGGWDAWKTGGLPAE